MADTYKGFTFGSTRVAIDGTPTYQGFIINSGDDLKFSNSPEFNNEFASPRLGDYAIYTGTTVSSKTFNFSVMLDAITLAYYREFVKAFWHEAVGYLRFDYAAEFGYMVKLSSIGEGRFTVVPGTPDTYHVEIDMEFVTTGDWAAYELITNALPNYLKASLPVALQDKTSFQFTWVLGTVTIKNKSQINQYFTIDFTESIQLDVNSDVVPDKDATILNVTRADTNLCRYYSQYGIVIDTTDGTFVSGTILPYSVEPGEEIITTVTTGVVDSVTILAREIL